MKIISISIISILCWITANAQVTQPPKFDTCQYLRTLEGEWLAVNSNDTIRIYLRFHRDLYVDPETYDLTSDQLYGWVEYKKETTTIMSNFEQRFLPLPHSLNDNVINTSSITIFPGDDGCTNPQLKLTGILEDLVRCHQSKKLSILVNSSATQMTWKISQPAAMLDNLWCAGITLPQEFTLTKQ